MGLPMAARLATRLEGRGLEPVPERLALAQEAGGRPFDSARGGVEGADAVLLAVRSGAQLDDVLFGETGVAAVLRPGAVVVLGSTVGTEAIPATVERLATYGVDLVDAPLSGGPTRAGA